LEYRVAVPLEYGPWAQFSPWAFSDRPQDYQYNPRTYPYPALNPYLPQRSGAYIQPGNMDPIAYALATSGSPEGPGLEGLDQESVKGILMWAAAGSVAGYFVLGKKQGALLGAVLGVVTKYTLGLFKASRTGQIDFAPEDPTGGAYEGGGDPFGDPLGPGESIAVASQYFGTLKPRGFTATL
jgi:hypothetical protein